MPIVECRGVTRDYQQGTVTVPALRGVDLSIEAGEFTVMMGPSGCGKTTLLNLMGGLDKATAGSIVVDGNDLSTLSGSKLSRLRLERVGFVFQAYNLLPVLTAYENAELVLMTRGVPAAERREKVMAMLKEVGLEGMENRRPNELSGGQQQRVAVARAIVGEPAIVLADEPTANLDSKTSQALVELLRQLNETHNITIICATHDKLVKEYGRRIVNMLDGQIVSEETH